MLLTSRNMQAVEAGRESSEKMNVVTASAGQNWSKPQCAVYLDDETGEVRKGSSVDWQIETLPFEARSSWSLDQLQACLSMVHDGVFCSGLHCRGLSSAIVGPRYRLSTWSDVDLCQPCFTSSSRLNSSPSKTNEPIPAFECLRPGKFVRVVYESITDKLPLIFFAEGTSTIYMRCVRDDLAARRGTTDCLPDEMDGAAFDKTILSDLTKLTGIYLGTELIDDYRKDALLADLRAGVHATRIVYLLPGDDAAPLTIALQYQRLENSRPYVALSYTWKDDELDGPSMASTLGHGDEVQMRDGRRIPITAGLRDALFRIRQSNPVAVHSLWIDQLCIDQTDPEERGLQVDIMWAIFAKAANLTLWIGEELKDTEDVFKVMRNVSNALVSRQWTVPPAIDTLEERRMKAKLIMDCGTVEQWYSVIEHFQRVVFTRGWVVQELLLSHRHTREVRCGSHTIQYMILALVGLWLSEHGELGTRFVSSIYKKVDKDNKITPHALDRGTFSHLDTLRNLLDEGSPIPLSALLLHCNAFQTGDPRDRIYCLLNVHQMSLKGTAPSAVSRADYTKSVSETFTDAIRSIMDNEKSLLLLENAGLSFSAKYGLPSWVPDFSWSNKSHRGLIVFNRESQYLQPLAAGDSVVSVHWPNKVVSHILQTSSYVLGRITSIGEAFDSSARDGNRSGRILTNWIATAGKAANVTLENHAESGKSFCRMFTWRWFPADKLPFYDHGIARVIMGVMVKHSERMGTDLFDAAHGVSISETDETAASTSERQAQFMSGERKLNFLFMYFMHKEKDQEPLQIDRDDESPILGSFDELLDCIARTMPSRNCFVLDSGHFGLGSWDVQVGDEVHIIQGSGMPFVCRRAKDEDEKKDVHMLIRDCYVPGIMDGEALSGPDFHWKTLNLI